MESFGSEVDSKVKGYGAKKGAQGALGWVTSFLRWWIEVRFDELRTSSDLRPSGQSSVIFCPRTFKSANSRPFAKSFTGTGGDGGCSFLFFTELLIQATAASWEILPSKTSCAA